MARVYDYWLGGKDNFAADRVAGEQAIQAYPDIVDSVRANRAFLARVVRYLAGPAGIRRPDTDEERNSPAALWGGVGRKN